MRRIDFDTGYKEQIIKNINKVRNDIDVPYMIEKIEKYCQKYDLPYMFVRNKILKDNIFALQFAKDPSKQSFHQHCAAKFISEITCVEDFKELNASGPKALFIEDGIVKTIKEISNKKETKSIDFRWYITTKTGKKITFYAAHKHTNDDGGSQDSQYTDLQMFMKHGSQSKNKDTYFLAIGDGPYYQREKGGKTRIEIANETYGTHHCIALTSNDIELLLEEIIFSYEEI